ncbi:MAG: transporter substrate-binding domain-containing protein [Firmicutes bacterium]|nr:transporter substrate-binding domain-containing protein [Bacillota bacterium]
MKKTIALLLTAVMLLGLLAGCGSAKSETKTLVVATSPDFAPMEFVSSDENAKGNDKYVGFDMTLAAYLAEGMGMELEIKPMSFDACQTAVEMGSVDMAISGFSWTEERAENFNLSDYYHAGDNEDEQIIITLAGNEGKYDTAEKLAGQKVGAQIASLQESLTKEQLPDSTLVTVADLTTAIMQLRNGDFVALAVAKGNGSAIIASNPDIIESGFSFEVDEKYTGNVVMMKKGADDLTAKVNELLAKAESEGKYGPWYEEAKATAGIEVSYDDQGNAAS